MATPVSRVTLVLFTAAMAKGAPQIHDNAPGNLIYDWGLGDEAAADAGLKARARPGVGGLVPDERHFLDSLRESVETGRSPADELIAHYEGDWGHDLTRIYDAYSY